MAMLTLSMPADAPVTFDVPEGAPHQLRSDPARQRMDFDLFHLWSFPMEPRETNTPGSDAERRPVEAVA